MSSNRTTNRHYAWVLVGLLWVVAFLNYLDRQIIYSVFPLLQAELKVSNVQLGLLSTAFLWIYGALSPISGFLADRFGRKLVIVLSLLVWSLVTWATGHAPSFAYLLWARGLMGISEAFYLPAGLALIADYHTERSRSLATGLHTSGIYLGMILGGAGGGWLGEHYGWRFAFTLLGLFGVLYTAVVAFGLKNRPASNTVRDSVRTPKFISSVRELFTLSGFGTLTLVFSAVSIANWIVYTWLPLYLYERFHMSLTGAGFSATFYIQGASVGGILLGGWLADRWSARSRRGRLFVQSLGLSLAGPFLFLAAFTMSPLWMIGSLVMFGVGRGFYDCNTMPVLSQMARPHLWSTGYGIFNSAGSIAGGLMAFVAGYLKAITGLGFSLQIAAILLCISAMLLLRIRLAPPASA